MGFLGSLGNYITPATQAVAGAEQGDVEGKQMLVARAIQARKLEHEQNLETLMAQRVADQTANTASLLANRGATWQQAPDGTWHHLGADGNEITGSAGRTTPPAATPSDPSVPPPAPPVAGRPGFQGIRKAVRQGATHIGSSPDGRSMVEQQQPDGTWSPAMTAQGDTVFTPSPTRGLNVKTAAERNRDTHFHVLNAQIQTTGQQINQLQKVVQAGQNPAADPQAIQMAQVAAAKLGELRTRSDSLTSARDQMATSLGPPGIAAPVTQPRRTAPRGTGYVAPPGATPLSKAEVLKAATDPDYRAYKESLGYKFDAPAQSPQ